MYKCIVFYLPVCLALISCNNSGYKSINTDGGNFVSESEDTDMQSLSSSDQQEGMMYLCPMCSGNKQIIHYSGQLILCPACQGSGQISETTLKQLQEAEQIGCDIANDFMNGSSNTSPYTGPTSTRSADAIQNDIDQCEREISNLQSGLENLDENSSLYIYYKQELTSLQYRLRQLQAELQHVE